MGTMKYGSADGKGQRVAEEIRLLAVTAYQNGDEIVAGYKRESAQETAHPPLMSGFPDAIAREVHGAVSDGSAEVVEYGEANFELRALSGVFVSELDESILAGGNILNGFALSIQQPGVCKTDGAIS